LLITKERNGSQCPGPGLRWVTVLFAATCGEQAGFRNVGSKARFFEGPDGGLSQSPSLLAQAGLKADFDAVHEHLGPQCSQLGGAPLRLVEKRQRSREISAAGGDKTLIVEHLGVPDGLAALGEDPRRCREILVRFVQLASVGMDQRPVLYHYRRFDFHAGGFERLDGAVKVVPRVYDPPSSLQHQRSLNCGASCVGTGQVPLGFVKHCDCLVKTPGVDPLNGQGHQRPRGRRPVPRRCEQFNGRFQRGLRLPVHAQMAAGSAYGPFGQRSYLQTAVVGLAQTFRVLRLHLLSQGKCPVRVRFG
jgi:hypothetical protein